MAISVQRIEAIMRNDPKVVPKTKLEALLADVAKLVKNAGVDETTMANIVSAALAEIAEGAPENMDTFKEVADKVDDLDSRLDELESLENDSF